MTLEEFINLEKDVQLKILKNSQTSTKFQVGCYTPKTTTLELLKEIGITRYKYLPKNNEHMMKEKFKRGHFWKRAVISTRCGSRGSVIHMAGWKKCIVIEMSCSRLNIVKEIYR